MLASEKSSEPIFISQPVSEDALPIPGVLLLLKDAFLASWKLRIVVYGYAAWLLLPLLMLIFAADVPAPYNNYLLMLEEVVSLILGLWVTAAITLYVGLVVTKEAGETIDFNMISQRAWIKTLPLLIIQILTVCAILVGGLLFIIPGVIAWVWAAFAAPATILSPRNIKQAFVHSHELSRGRFFKVLGRLLGGNLAFAALIVCVFIGYLVAGLEGDISAIIPTLYAWPTWLEIGLVLLTLPLIPVTIIFHLLLYFALKRSYSAPKV